MREKDKQSIIKRLSEVEAATFDQDTIKLLLIELRDHIRRDSIIKDIAHFAAHSERDRGFMCEQIKYVSLARCQMCKRR